MTSDDAAPTGPAGRGNEFEDPGVNYPDRKDGETEAPGEQRSPLLEQNDATVRDKIDGIVDQTRADVGGKPLFEVAAVLRQRLADAGIELSEADVATLAHRATDFS